MVVDDANAHRYGTGYSPDFRSCTEAYLWPPVIELLQGIPKGTCVLDAGCGNGYFARAVRDRGFDVVGMDLERTGIEAARTLVPEARFEIASVYDDVVALFDRQFDAVVALEVVEHLYDPRQFARRMRECLRPGGRFVLSTPYHGYLKNLSIALAGKFDAHVSPLWDGGHVKFWSRRTLTALLEEAGFRVDAFIGAGRMPYLWKSMILSCS